MHVIFQQKHYKEYKCHSEGFTYIKYTDVKEFIQVFKCHGSCICSSYRSKSETLIKAIWMS